VESSEPGGAGEHPTSPDPTPIVPRGADGRAALVGFGPPWSPSFPEPSIPARAPGVGSKRIRALAQTRRTLTDDDLAVTDDDLAVCVRDPLREHDGEVDQ
jgi:hypothetical protein